MAMSRISDFSSFTSHSDTTKNQHDNSSYQDDFLIAVGKAKAMTSLVLELENDFMSENHNKKYCYRFGRSNVIVEATRRDELDEGVPF